MSVVEDVRQALQDFVTPEMRALTVRVENLEKAIGELRREMREQGDATRRELQAGMTQIAENLRLDKRITLLEENLQRKEQ